jgi:hypothetical protein
MVAVLFEIDGKPTRSWFILAPCGCACGCHVVNEGAMTEDEVWKSFTPNAEQRRRDKAAGFRIEVGPRSDVLKLSDKCPHTPKWGVEKAPVPEGHQWAREYCLTYGRRKHLVPDIGVENCTEGRYGAGHTAALCGSEAFHWHTEWYAVDGIPECLTCVKKASA